ncbi:carbonyl reductase [NADPH] 1-like [Pararge aegeria]|uniref:carbonyl reductase (NADPH) n=1 Tax=Pararge aegeria aegeria TaxID=348720 RepID=A0A8S4R939_9NEOP|nr:carbonyl reductase [NADPH] 1-like [Pararge aegeria]CAH2232586.1 jg10147 [Pararge aegeria aegeria]
MGDKLAVVTGSNKGIGYATVRQLCKRGVGYVYLTARDIKRGEKAIENLKKEGFKPLFYQLDVTDRNSVRTFAEHLKQTHGGLDILINNAALITSNFTETTYEDSVRVIDANYFSILTIQEYMFPILKDNARVINISSDCGHISNLKNTYWINRLTKQDIKLDDINAFVNWFLDSVKNGTLNEEDFQEMPLLAYRISKIALCSLTRVQQKEVGRGISVNSLHPGYVKTDMTKTTGFLTIEEASEAPVYLALDVDQSVKGKYFWFDKTEKEWADPNLKIHSTYAVVEKCLRELNIIQ